MFATKEWVKGLLSKVLKKTVNNYSTEEQRVGTWIDGKPLYQKTIESIIPTTSKNGSFAQSEIDISNLSIKTCISIQGTFSNNNNTYSLPWTTNDVNMVKAIIKANNSIEIYNSYAIFSKQPIYITIQYTKTTD